MSTCTICLNHIRKTRSTAELPCGHLFHKNCIKPWEERGNETCPLCRMNTSSSNFRVTLHIENLRTQDQTTLNLDLNRIQRILTSVGINIEDIEQFTSDIIIDADDLESLESILSDFGISISDVDPSVLHAE
jgi:hypothetical protein